MNGQAGKQPVTLPELLVLLAGLCIPTAIVTPWNHLPVFTDFPEYYAGAKLIAAGRFPDVYSIPVLGSLENNLYPLLQGRVVALLLFPILSWCLAPLALLSYEAAFAVWMIILPLALVAALILFSNLFALTRKQRLWAAAILGTSGACLECLRIGQPAALYLLGLAILAYGIKNKKLSLAAVGQSVLWLKPHLLLPLVIFQVGAGLHVLVRSTLLIGAAGLLVAVLLGGGAVIETYYQLMTSQLVHLYMGTESGPTWRAQLLRIGVTGILGDAMTYGAYALMLVLVFIIGKLHAGRSTFGMALFAGVVPLMLLFAPHLHNYDLVLLFPGLLCVFLSEFATPAMRRTAGLVIGFLTAPVYVLIHYLYVVDLNFFFIAVALWTTVVVSRLIPRRSIESLR